MSCRNAQIKCTVRLGDASKPARTCGSRAHVKILTTKKTKLARRNYGVPIIRIIGGFIEPSTLSTRKRIAKSRSLAMPNVARKSDCKERT